MFKEAKKAGITGCMVYAAAYAAKTFQHMDLIHFSPKEFGVWWPIMDSKLLIKLDSFRGKLNSPVIVSPVSGAVGRVGKGDSTMHYPAPFVRAIDIMVPKSTLQAAYDAAMSVGFTGIGLYPDWQPHHGLHLDVRPLEADAMPATWSGIRMSDGSQQYFGVNRALS